MYDLYFYLYTGNITDINNANPNKAGNNNQKIKWYIKGFKLGSNRDTYINNTKIQVN